jgi:Leucine-rich repeat (LRR) protein
MGIEFTTYSNLEHFYFIHNLIIRRIYVKTYGTVVSLSISFYNYVLNFIQQHVK